MAGFEAVLLALYGAETKARGGRPVTINIPDLGQASLYHSPRQTVGDSKSVRPLSRCSTIFMFIGDMHVQKHPILVLNCELPYKLLAVRFCFVLDQIFKLLLIVWPQHVEVISPALEPESSVKSTKRSVIVGIALELFHRRIILMPSKAKLDLCHYARR